MSNADVEIYDEQPGDDAKSPRSCAPETPSTTPAHASWPAAGTTARAALCTPWPPAGATYPRSGPPARTVNLTASVGCAMRSSASSRASPFRHSPRPSCEPCASTLSTSVHADPSRAGPASGQPDPTQGPGGRTARSSHRATRHGAALSSANDAFRMPRAFRSRESAAAALQEEPEGPRTRRAGRTIPPKAKNPNRINAERRTHPPLLRRKPRQARGLPASLTPGAGPALSLPAARSLMRQSPPKPVRDRPAAPPDPLPSTTVQAGTSAHLGHRYEPGTRPQQGSHRRPGQRPCRGGGHRRRHPRRSSQEHRRPPRARPSPAAPTTAKPSPARTTVRPLRPHHLLTLRTRIALRAITSPRGSAPHPDPNNNESRKTYATVNLTKKPLPREHE